MTRSPLPACLLLAMSLAVAARERVLRTDAVLAEQQRTRLALEASDGPYRDLTAEQRRSLAERQRRLAALLDGKADTAQLEPGDREEVFRLVAGIDADLRRADGNRLVCARESRTGSHFIARACRSRDEARRQQAEAQQLLKDKTDARMHCADASGCP